MSKLTQHRTRIRKRYNYSKSALEKGMICEMTYKRRLKKGDPTRLETKKYIIVVLNSNFRGALHAMSLEHISSGQLNDLASDWGLKSIGKGPAFAAVGILTGLRVPKLTMEESSGRFYSSTFTKEKGTIIDSYRTFIVKNIGGSLSVIDYEWDKGIFRTQFAELIEAQAEEKRLAEELLLTEAAQRKAESDEEARKALERGKKKILEKAKQKAQKAVEKGKKPGNL